MKPATSDPFAAVATAVAAAKWEQARAELQRLQKTLDPRLAPQIQAWRYRIAPFWWQPLQGGGIVLRRTHAGDADFYRSCFADPGFASRYNRQPPWKGDLARALLLAGTRSPVDLTAQHWIVTDRSDSAIGLAALTSLNPANRKAEFSIGFPGVGPSNPSGSAGRSAMATLLVFHFAFFLAGLNKLTAYVYSGNEVALRSAQRIGFQIEGLLKDHFFLPPGEFVDVHALGLTRTQLLANAEILRMSRRRLGLQWAGRS
jgi:RimJ/RimL family protein N-acetyltransferase